MTALESLKERLLAESAALDAQVATCEHDLHKSPIGCPYCKRDTRQRDLLREAAEAIVVSPPADSAAALDLAVLEVWLGDRQEGEALPDCVARHIARARASALRQAQSAVSISPAPDGDGRHAQIRRLIARLETAKLALESWCASSRDQAFNAVYREWRDCRPEKIAALIQSTRDELEAVATLVGEAGTLQRLRLTVCTRERTRGNVYNYNYWKCGYCGYHPGGSDGPPNEKCLNCHRRLYTDDAGEAALLIRIVPWEAGLHFKIVEDLRALREQARAALLQGEEGSSGISPSGGVNWPQLVATLLQRVALDGDDRKRAMLLMCRSCYEAGVDQDWMAAAVEDASVPYPQAASAPREEETK